MLLEEKDSVVSQLVSFLFQMSQFSPDIRVSCPFVLDALWLINTCSESLVLLLELLNVNSQSCVLPQRVIQLGF